MPKKGYKWSTERRAEHSKRMKAAFNKIYYNNNSIENNQPNYYSIGMQIHTITEKYIKDIENVLKKREIE